MACAKSRTGVVLLLLSAIFTLSVCSIKCIPFQLGLDPSNQMVANVYGDYGLEPGRDIVHVWGPLGWLYWTGFVHNHLFFKGALTLVLLLSFAGVLALLAATTQRYIACAVFLLITACFASSRSVIAEPMLYTFCLTFYVIDMRMPGYRLNVIPAALTGMAVFIKFNMAMALTATLIAYSIIAWIYDNRRVSTPATTVVAFLSVAALTGITHFNSPAGFVSWLDSGLQVSASNSEAMSIPAPGAALILASAIAIILLLLFRELRRSGTRREALLWGILGGILSFFSFKHGFVRGDGHIFYFFLFMPALAASSLLLYCSFRTLSYILLVVCISLAAPAFSQMKPASTTPLVCLKKNIAQWEQCKTSWLTRTPLNSPGSLLSPQEVLAIGGATVEAVPWDVSPVYAAGLNWRPAPFFQYFMARTERADARNAGHIRGTAAADYILWTWEAIDRGHPLFTAPRSQLAILRRYRPLIMTGERLLLKRSPEAGLTRRPLGATRAALGESISVPASNGFVIARIGLRPSLLGNLIKAVAWAPPVYIVFGDGAEFRITPAAARSGVIINGLPRDISQYWSIARYGRPSQESPVISSFRIVQESSLPVFPAGIEVAFEEVTLQIADSGDAH